MIHVWQERKSVLQSVSWDKNQKLCWWLWCWSGTQVKVKAWSQVWSKTKQLVSVFPQFVLHGIQESDWRMSERPGNEVYAPHKRRTKKETTTSDATAQSFQSILLEQERKDDTDPSLGMGIKIPHTSLSFTAANLIQRKAEKKEEAKMKMLPLNQLRVIIRQLFFLLHSFIRYSLSTLLSFRCKDLPLALSSFPPLN